MNPSERKKVSRRIEHDLEYCSLAKAIDLASEIIDKKPKLNFSNFQFLKEYSYGDSVNIYLEYDDVETDAEVKAREDALTMQAEYRRRQYEEMKKEFEGGSKA